MNTSGVFARTHRGALVAVLSLVSTAGCNLIGYETRTRANDAAADLDAQARTADAAAPSAPSDATPSDAGAPPHALDPKDAETLSLRSDAAILCVDAAHCNYACPPGSTVCELECLGSKECVSRCTAGARCRTTCQGAEHCHIDCPPFSSCEIICRGSAECQPHCADNSVCHITCIDNECKGVACDPRADCTLDCLGTSDCAFMRCDKPMCLGEQTLYCGGVHTCRAAL